MKGTTIAEMYHIVNILPAHDGNTVATPEVFSMREAAHATIIVQFGVTGAATTVTVEACDDFAATTTEAIPFAYYAETTAAGDTLGARTAATTSGFSSGANDNTFFVIEVDAAELPAGKPNLRLVLSDPGATTYVSAVAILSGMRLGAAATQIV